MWIAAGLLLGALVIAVLLGSHAGPHLHVAAAGFGLAAAVVLILLALHGPSRATAWTLIGIDAAALVGLAFLIPFSIRSVRRLPPRPSLSAIGKAVTELNPDGIVHVGGQDWSATTNEGSINQGSPVVVVGGAGLHLIVAPGSPQRTTPIAADVTRTTAKSEKSQQNPK
jgi:membrane-bound ClpP family serine protease